MVIAYHAVNENWAVGQYDFVQGMILWTSTSIYYSFVVIGVPLFVMLSGALLLQPAKVNEPIRVFLKKRLARIGVAFAFWSAIYFLWDYFMNHTPLTAYSITQALLEKGAYYQFWFIYVIMGLYLITPILRVVVSNADRRILRYLIVLWFLSASFPPLLHLITGLAIDNTLFLFGGYIGYFVLGEYLIGFQVKTRTIKALLAAGVALTFLGLFLMNFPFHDLTDYYFFTDYLSMNVILASVASFLLLARYPSNWPSNGKPWLGKLVRAISENTLAIFFMHVIVLETLNRGIFGVQVSLLHMPPPLEVPIATAVTLFVCLAAALALKKVPVLGKLIG